MINDCLGKSQEETKQLTQDWEVVGSYLAGYFSFDLLRCVFIQISRGDSAFGDNFPHINRMLSCAAGDVTS